MLAALRHAARPAARSFTLARSSPTSPRHFAMSASQQHQNPWTEQPKSLDDLKTYLVVVPDVAESKRCVLAGPLVSAHFACLHAFRGMANDIQSRTCTDQCTAPTGWKSAHSTSRRRGLLSPTAGSVRPLASIPSLVII
jgi:hypothetical protein